MMIELNRVGRNASAPHGALPFFDDPLGQDEADDGVVVSSRRGLCRLAIVAAEAGARAERGDLPCDPMAWLLAPRRAFDGDAALDACLSRQGMLRATALGAIGAVDAEPELLDELLADDTMPPSSAPPGSRTPGRNGRRWNPEEPRLYTASLRTKGPRGTLNVFLATVANSAMDARAKLRMRLPGDVADRATVRPGFDDGDRLACSIFSQPMLELLRYMATHPLSPLTDGLDLYLEQRVGQ